MAAASEEDIVRSISTDKWDGERLAPSLFTGGNSSVSRLAVIALADHWDMFGQYVQGPPERLLVLIGEINIGHLQQIGRAYKQPTVLTGPQDYEATQDYSTT